MGSVNLCARKTETHAAYAFDLRNLVGTERQDLEQREAYILAAEVERAEDWSSMSGVESY